MEKSTPDRFTWIPFYEELANKLLEYRNRRKELLKIVYSSLDGYVDFLQDEQGRKFTDIDPFTIFSIFNRSIKSKGMKDLWDRRFKICKLIQQSFNLQSKVPRDFYGIPLVNFQRSYFSYPEFRDGIEHWWDLLDCAIKSRDITSHFDFVVRIDGITRTTTNGLFWVRPKRYMPLDDRSKAYLKKAGIDVPNDKNLCAENYLRLMDEIKKSDHPLIRGRNFYEISFNARKESQKIKQAEKEEEIMAKLSEPQINLSVKLLELNKNIILQGAPGTGKTFSTARIALRVIGEDVQKQSQVKKRYEKLQDEGRIFFTTFHQSMDYEDFVEGLKPEVVEDGNGVEYKVSDGIFKQVCQAAEEDERPVVLIIDEINRGNVSKIFGELITLLEADKRIGGKHPVRVELPYSKDEEGPFGVPSNVYIIGTMNTTDRSTGTLDYALRRRFSFVTLKADKEIIQNPKGRELFEDVERFVRDFQTGEIELDDLMIGHSYFMAGNDEELKLKIEYEVIPLLKEYIKDGLLNCREKEMNAYFEAWRNLQTKPAQKDEDGTNS